MAGLRTARILGLLLTSTLSCQDGLQLVVVERGAGNGGAASGQSGALATGATDAKGATGGAGAGTPIGGSTTDGGVEPVAGSAGKVDDGASGAGGEPEVPVWDAPARYTASFVSHAFPGQYMRHVAEEGFIGVIDLASKSEREDASFELTPGLNDENCSSFRAVNKKGSFFRHSGSRIYLLAADNVPLFRADATFCEEPGMADSQGVTFRSSNYGGRVIHLRNENELWIDDVPDPMTPEFASTATFYRETPLSELGSP